MNLTEANLRGPDQDPSWSELYRAKEEYGLADLSPSSIETLVQRMLKDEALFQLYFKCGLILTFCFIEDNETLFFYLHQGTITKLWTRW